MVRYPLYPIRAPSKCPKSTIAAECKLSLQRTREHARHDKLLPYLTNCMRKSVLIAVSQGLNLLEDEKIVQKSGIHSGFILTASMEKRIQIIEPDSEVVPIEHENTIRR